MSKKEKHRHTIQKHEAHAGNRAKQPREMTPAEIRHDGLQAFKAGHYALAIQIWSKLDQSDPNSHLPAAIAEAHFRQAAKTGLGPDSLPDLERTIQLQPQDPLYAYTYGLALHKLGRLEQAQQAYRRAVELGLSRPGAGVVIALAALEANPRADLASTPGVSAEDIQTLTPLINLLQNQRATKRSHSFLDTITQRLKLKQPPPHQPILEGLALLANQQLAEARQALMAIEGKRLPREANAIRWYYYGVAAAQTGDMAAALQAWKQTRTLAPDLDRLHHNLLAAYAGQANAKFEAGDWRAAAQSALAGLEILPGEPRLSQLALVSLDRAAHAAVQAGEWDAASQQWVEARQVLSQITGGNSPRPILHNLALAYETLAQWENAADAWRAMLRTKPRKKSAEGLSDAHWEWIRRHVTECYKRAGRPGEAVSVYRQAIKANPDDADLQMELAEALLANEQTQAAINELNRLLEKQPERVDALVHLAEIHAHFEEWYLAEPLLQRAMKLEPDNPDLRSRMATMLQLRARQSMYWGQVKQAHALLENALQYAPDSYKLYLDLARIELSGKHTSQASAYIERALELGSAQADAYGEAFTCWVSADKPDEARRILARAEAAIRVDREFYVNCGTICLKHDAPMPEIPDPFDYLTGRKPKPPVHQEYKPSEMQQLGQELFEKAIELGPAVDALGHIIAQMGHIYPRLTIPYARRLAEGQPDEPHNWVALGILYGLNQQSKEADEAMRQAEQVARRQGNTTLARQIREQRKRVANPMFAAIARMASLMDKFGMDDFEDEDLEDYL